MASEGYEGVDGRIVVEFDVGSKELPSLREPDS